MHMHLDGARYLLLHGADVVGRCHYDKRCVWVVHVRLDGARYLSLHGADVVGWCRSDKGWVWVMHMHHSPQAAAGEEEV